MVRGNQKQRIFRSTEDYLLYLALLKKFKRKYKFKVYAYCLMPNHVHLLGEIENSLMLSKFMHDLNRTYTLYFNNKYSKVGHLWQGRFKSMTITKDKYLIDCINYIELNPLRSALVQKIADYPWSSYHARALGKESKVIDQLNSI
jgi:putative transposase